MSSGVEIKKPIKHLCIFADGTLRGFNEGRETNVVKACRLLSSTNEHGEKQIVFYVDGVGLRESTWRLGFDGVVSKPVSKKLLEKIELGEVLFGYGVVDRLSRAYRFLVLNYDPGDRIYIFGYSRGAFLARALVFLLRYSGIVSRDKLHRCDEAVDMFVERVGADQADPDRKSPTVFRESNCDAYVVKSVLDDRDISLEPIADLFLKDGQFRKTDLSVRYLGLWDSVDQSSEQAAIRADKNVSRMVESVRHAVALDECRKFIPQRLVDNIAVLNQRRCKMVGQAVGALASGDRYLQHVFPGDHGAVGGGGVETIGLANLSLLWILIGAERSGLQFEWNSPLGQDIGRQFSIGSATFMSGKNKYWRDRGRWRHAELETENVQASPLLYAYWARHLHYRTNGMPAGWEPKLSNYAEQNAPADPRSREEWVEFFERFQH